MPIDATRSDNRDNWDDRVAGHIDGYRVDRYIDDPDHMSDVVMFDQDRVRDQVPLMYTLVAQKQTR